MHTSNCFITLTYDNEYCPKDYSLNYEDFQLFMKRLRKRFKGFQVVTNYPEKKIRNKWGKVIDTISLDPYDEYPIRFYMCGEYGENFGRPHFHACLFNFDFVDKTYWSKSPGGSKIYRSDILEDLWPFGFSSIGEVNFQSAAYVARYIMKKVTGKSAAKYYKSVS